MLNREIAGQVLRYGLSGAVLALLYSLIYWTLAVPFGVPVLVANTVAFLVNLVAGWIVHSKWSFRGHGLAGQAHIAYARFLVVNLMGYAMNSFWVWLLVKRMGASVVISTMPIIFATPLFSFCVNRFWIFRQRL